MYIHVHTHGNVGCCEGRHTNEHLGMRLHVHERSLDGLQEGVLEAFLVPLMHVLEVPVHPSVVQETAVNLLKVDIAGGCQGCVRLLLYAYNYHNNFPMNSRSPAINQF